MEIEIGEVDKEDRENAVRSGAEEKEDGDGSAHSCDFPPSGEFKCNSKGSRRFPSEMTNEKGKNKQRRSQTRRFFVYSADDGDVSSD
jgi:hypothetical protein